MQTYPVMNRADILDRTPLCTSFSLPSELKPHPLSCAYPFQKPLACFQFLLYVESGNGVKGYFA